MAGTEVADLGFTSGQVVQEFGWDEDVDDAIREAIEDATGEELVDEYYGDVSDGSLIWWHDDDGDLDDLADLIVDAQTNLDDGGVLWVFCPKTGLDGFVPAADVQDAARTAGVVATTVTAMGDWSGVRLSARGRGK